MVGYFDLGGWISYPFTHMVLLALDFDGVLCDSARETGITGWKAAGTLWEDMAEPLPPQQILDGFIRTRAVVETGYEAILMMRLLKDGEEPDELLETFPQRLHESMARSGSDATGLKRLFGSVRDRWIQDDPSGWLSLSPLYPGAAEALNALPPATGCYIITTKQERFVQHLLDYNRVRFAAGHIFGLDREMTKEAVLRRLMEQCPGCRIHFVEDRLATLKRLVAQPGLAAVGLHLACWGYNTEADRREAVRLKIHLLRELSLAGILNMEHEIDQ
jgi:phosphoglycolate phosphatase-like HAD superfamily hydrolase